MRHDNSRPRHTVFYHVPRSATSTRQVWYGPPELKIMRPRSAELLPPSRPADRSDILLSSGRPYQTWGVLRRLSVGAGTVRRAVALKSRRIGRRVKKGCSVGVGRAFHQACGFTRRIVTPAQGRYRTWSKVTLWAWDRRFNKLVVSPAIS